MHRVQIPVTGIGLLGLFAFPEVGVFRNLVIANSVAGLWYMRPHLAMFVLSHSL